MFDPCVFPNITGAEHQMQRQERTGHFHVNSQEVEHVLRWCDRQVQGPDVSHKICGNDTNLPSNITLVKSNLQKTCSKSQNSKSNNVRPMCFPNITGAQRQMQRQERTGHFHVNSEEERNMFYDGVIVKCRDPTFLTRFAAMTQIYHRTLR